MAENETKPDAQDRWADLSPEAVQKLWEEIQAKISDEDPICMNCENRIWPIRLRDDYEVSHSRIRYPVCACHVDSPGVPREIHPCEGCANFRPRPKAIVRGGKPPKRERPSDRFIPLTRGLWAVVDVRDFEWLSEYCWYASPSGGGKMYARRNTKTGTILMHREIMKTPKGLHVDHKDRNGLNNCRRGFEKPASRSENCVSEPFSRMGVVQQGLLAAWKCNRFVKVAVKAECLPDIRTPLSWLAARLQPDPPAMGTQEAARSLPAARIRGRGDRTFSPPHPACAA